MSTNSIVIDAPPARVFSVLLDPYAYADWVVGTRRVRGVDPTWPDVGTRFHHTVEPDIRDNSEITAIRPDELLVLEVRFRPVGIASVEFRLQPLAGGRRTRLTLTETPLDGPLRRLPSPVANSGLFARNQVSLRRLRRLVARRAQSPAAAG